MTAPTVRLTCPDWCVVSDHDQHPPVDWVHSTDDLASVNAESTPGGGVSVTIEQWAEVPALICLEAHDAYLTRDEASKVATILLNAVAKLDEIDGAT